MQRHLENRRWRIILNTISPKYQLLEGALEEMQEAINAYAEDGYRLVSLTAVRVRGSGVGTVMNEYACVLERVEGKG